MNQSVVLLAIAALAPSSGLHAEPLEINSRLNLRASAMIESIPRSDVLDEQMVDLFLSRDDNTPSIDIGEVFGADASLGDVSSSISANTTVMISDERSLFVTEIAGESLAASPSRAESFIELDYFSNIRATRAGEVEIRLLIDLLTTDDDGSDPIIDVDLNVSGLGDSLRLENTSDLSFFSEVVTRRDIEANESFVINSRITAGTDAAFAPEIRRLRVVAEVTFVPSPATAMLLAAGGLFVKSRRRLPV